MTSKFGSLAANVSDAFKVEIIDPISDAALKDKDGKVAFIEVLSTDSDAGRAFDKEQRAVLRRKAMKSRNGLVEGADQLEENIAKASVLVKSWHLVDPVTKEALDVPCTKENASELFSAPGMNWLFVQVWVAANDSANFMQRSPRN